MRELHVVALSEDGRFAVLAASPDASRGGFRIALDDRLAAALRGDLARPEEPERESTLTPREIQARLRAGESAEQIAHSAGVPLARVERFSGPVLSERARVVEMAQAAVLERARRGRSVVPLGEAVEHHLAQMATLRPESTQWTARREEDGRWLVEVVWVARARTRFGRWYWDPSDRSVTPVDPESAALGHLEAAAPQAVERPARASPGGRAAPAAAGAEAVARRPRAGQAGSASRRTAARRLPPAAVPRETRGTATARAARAAAMVELAAGDPGHAATDAAPGPGGSAAAPPQIATARAATRRTSAPASGAPASGAPAPGAPAPGAPARGSAAPGSAAGLPTSGAPDPATRESGGRAAAGATPTADLRPAARLQGPAAAASATPVRSPRPSTGVRPDHQGGPGAATGPSALPSTRARRGAATPGADPAARARPGRSPAGGTGASGTPADQDQDDVPTFTPLRRAPSAAAARAGAAGPVRTRPPAASRRKAAPRPGVAWADDVEADDPPVQAVAAPAHAAGTPAPLARARGARRPAAEPGPTRTPARRRAAGQSDESPAGQPDVAPVAQPPAADAFGQPVAPPTGQPPVLPSTAQPAAADATGQPTGPPATQPLAADGTGQPVAPPTGQLPVLPSTAGPPAAHATGRPAAPSAEEPSRTLPPAPEALPAASSESDASSEPDGPAGPPVLRVVPSHPSGQRPATSRDARRRASVPAWADVLLSTAPRPDEGVPQD